MSRNELLIQSADVRGLRAFAKAMKDAPLDLPEPSTSSELPLDSLGAIAAATSRHGHGETSTRALLASFAAGSLSQRLCAATALQKSLFASQPLQAQLRELVAPLAAVVVNGAVDHRRTPLSALQKLAPSDLDKQQDEPLRDLGSLALEGRWYALGSVVFGSLVDDRKREDCLGDLIEILLDGNAGEQLPAERFKLGEEESPARADLAEYFMLRQALQRPEMREGLEAVRDLIEAARGPNGAGPLTRVAHALFSVGDAEEARQTSMQIDPLVRKTRRNWRFGAIARTVLAAVGLPTTANVANLFRGHVDKFGNDSLMWLGVLHASDGAIWQKEIHATLLAELASAPDDVVLWQALALSGLLRDDAGSLLNEINVRLHEQWNRS